MYRFSFLVVLLMFLLLAASGQRPIQQDQRSQLVPSDLSQAQLGVKQIAISIQSATAATSSRGSMDVEVGKPIATSTLRTGATTSPSALQ
jgi:hypothetical protein